MADRAESFRFWPVSAFYSASSVDEKYRFGSQLLLLAVVVAFDLSFFVLLLF